MLPAGCFSLWSPKFCYCDVVLPGHLSQHSKAATAEGLTFSDTIHKKSAGNLNLYNFCHSPKKLAAVSPFREDLKKNFSIKAQAKFKLSHSILLGVE
jgi:hypothetical protein